MHFLPFLEAMNIIMGARFLEQIVFNLFGYYAVHSLCCGYDGSLQCCVCTSAHSLGAHYPLMLVPLLNMLCLCSQFTCSINFHCCRAIRGPLYSVVKAGGVRWALMVYLSVSCYASPLAHTHRGEPPIHKVVSLAAVISCIIHKPSLVVYRGHRLCALFVRPIACCCIIIIALSIIFAHF